MIFLMVSQKQKFIFCIAFPKQTDQGKKIHAPTEAEEDKFASV